MNKRVFASLLITVFALGFTYWCGKPTPLGVGWIAI